MNEQNPHRTPIQVELSPEHAERIRVQTEAFENVGAAAIEAKRQYDENQSGTTEAVEPAADDLDK